jgi:opacity protein-like surface antigen
MHYSRPSGSSKSTVTGDTMKKLLCAVALAAVLGVPASASAQLQAGPILAYHTDLEAVGVGAFLGIPIPSVEGLSIVPDFTWFFPDGGDYFEINGDVVYTFAVTPDSPVEPFAFAGLNIARVSPDFGNSDTDVGLNLGGGVNFVAGSLNPFAGAKFEIQNETGFVIFGGLGFALGN